MSYVIVFLIYHRDYMQWKLPSTILEIRGNDIICVFFKDRKMKMDFAAIELSSDTVSFKFMKAKNRKAL